MTLDKVLKQYTDAQPILPARRGFVDIYEFDLYIVESKDGRWFGIVEGADEIRMRELPEIIKNECGFSVAGWLVNKKSQQSLKKEIIASPTERDLPFLGFEGFWVLVLSPLPNKT